jgi:hypothetical protein
LAAHFISGMAQPLSLSLQKTGILRADLPGQQFCLLSQSRRDELQHFVEKLKRELERQKAPHAVCQRFPQAFS